MQNPISKPLKRNQKNKANTFKSEERKDRGNLQ